MVVSEAFLSEYARALNYDRVSSRHGLDASEREAAIEDFRRLAVIVKPIRSLSIVERDPSDNIFLECALARQADYIVSGDRHLRDVGVFEGIQILAPATFLEMLQREGLISDA